MFDTQVAAGFAGLGAQSSYDSLLTALLGLRLAKTASFTRWDTRPLSAEQVAYAREDVVHLLELAEVLEGRLRELGRLQWALEECEVVAKASDERDLETILRRLPRVSGLSAQGHRRRPRARGLEGVGGRAPGPARPGGAQRRDAGRARPAQPRLAGGARTDPGPWRRASAAAAERSCWR